MSAGPPQPPSDPAALADLFGYPNPGVADAVPIRDQRDPAAARAAHHARAAARAERYFTRELKHRRPSAARAIELIARRAERLEERS